MIGLSVEDAALQNGVSPACWRYWAKGQKTPSRENMVQLYEWSLGHVTPNDFYDLPALPDNTFAARTAANQGLSSPVSLKVRCMKNVGQSRDEHCAAGLIGLDQIEMFGGAA